MTIALSLADFGFNLLSGSMTMPELQCWIRCGFGYALV